MEKQKKDNKEETPEEVLQTIEKQHNIVKSQAVKVKNLKYQYKKLFKLKRMLRSFKQPVMYFERRSGKVEFYEKATMGIFEFKHTDGENRFIILTPNKQKEFGFGEHRYKGYYCHEDFPLPLPEDPLITTEQMNIIVDKSLNDIKEWKAKEIKAKSGFWKIIFIGMAGLIGLYIVYRIVVPNNPPTAQEVQTIAEIPIQLLNVTPTIIG